VLSLLKNVQEFSKLLIDFIMNKKIYNEISI